MMSPPVPDPAPVDPLAEESPSLPMEYRPNGLLRTVLYVVSYSIVEVVLGWLLISPATTCANQTGTFATPHVLTPK